MKNVRFQGTPGEWKASPSSYILIYRHMKYRLKSDIVRGEREPGEEEAFLASGVMHNSPPEPSDSGIVIKCHVI